MPGDVEYSYVGATDVANHIRRVDESDGSCPKRSRSRSRSRNRTRIGQRTGEWGETAGRAGGRAGGGEARRGERCCHHHVILPVSAPPRCGPRAAGSATGPTGWTNYRPSVRDEAAPEIAVSCQKSRRRRRQVLSPTPSPPRRRRRFPSVLCRGSRGAR